MNMTILKQLILKQLAFLSVCIILFESPVAISQVTSADQPLEMQDETKTLTPADVGMNPGISPNGVAPVNPAATVPPTPAVAPAPAKPAGSANPTRQSGGSGAPNRNAAPQGRTANANSQCTANVGIIFEDVSKRNDPKNRNLQISMPWADLGWLDSHLGAPSGSTTVPQSIIHWDNFNVIVRKGVIVKTLGQYPGKSQPQDDLVPVFMGKAERDIGPPLNTYKENLTQFVWNCADSSSTLTVLADDQGSVLSVSGIYCNPELDCRSFGLAIGDSNLTQKLSK